MSGIKVVVAGGPADAKGLLLASIQDPDPVIFFEPKMMYATSSSFCPCCKPWRALFQQTLLRWQAPHAVQLALPSLCQSPSN